MDPWRSALTESESLTHLHPDEGKYWRLEELDQSVQFCQHVHRHLLVADGHDDVPGVGVAASQDAECEGGNLEVKCRDNELRA